MNSLIKMNRYLCDRNSSPGWNSTSYLFVQRLDTVSIYLLPFLSIVGNALIIIVILTNHQFNRSSFSVYVKSMAISDTCVLVIKFLSYMNRKPKFYQPSMCKILVFSSDISLLISVWIIAVITIERTLVVLFPLHKKKFVSVSRARAIVITISILAVCIASRTLFITIDDQIRPNFYCMPRGDWEKYRSISAIVLEFSYCYIPLSIVIIGNLLTICTVKQAVARRQNLVTTNSQKNMNSNENQLMLMLLIVTLMFIVYFVPYTVVKLTPRFVLMFNFCFTKKTFGIYTIIFSLSTLLKDLNFCTNFFIYSISGRRFRYALKNLFQKIHHHTSQQYELTRMKSDYLIKKNSEPRLVQMSMRNTFDDTNV